MENPRVQYIDRIVDVPVVMHRQVPTIQTRQYRRRWEGPQSQYLDRVADVLIVDDAMNDATSGSHVQHIYRIVDVSTTSPPPLP